MLNLPRTRRRGPRTTAPPLPERWCRRGMPPARPARKGRWHCGGPRRRICSGPAPSGGTAGSRHPGTPAVIPPAVAMRLVALHTVLSPLASILMDKYTVKEITLALAIMLICHSKVTTEWFGSGIDIIFHFRKYRLFSVVGPKLSLNSTVHHCYAK